MRQGTRSFISSLEEMQGTVEAGKCIGITYHVLDCLFTFVYYLSVAPVIVSTEVPKVLPYLLQLYSTF